MSEWSLVTIEDIAATNKGAIAIGPFGSRMKGDSYVDSGVKVIRGNNISETKIFKNEFVYVSQEFAEGLGNANVYGDDLVFPHRGAIGLIGIIPKDEHYVLSSSLMKLTVDTELASPEYVFYYFRSKLGRHEILKFSSTVGTPGIGQPLSSLRKMKLPLPKLAEQHDIASVLSKLDDKIDLLHRQNRTLEQMAETLFRQWFVEDAKENWDKGTIENFGKVITGKTPSKNNPDFWGSEYLFVTPSDFKGFGMYTTQTNRSLSNHGWDKFKSLQLPANCILVTCIGSDMGKVVISNSDCITNQQLNAIIPNEDHAVGYIYHFLKSKYNLLRSMALGGTTMPIINKGNFSSIEIPIPPVGVLMKFHEMWRGIASKIEFNQLQIRTLVNLRDTLLPKLMSGEVVVSDLSNE